MNTTNPFLPRFPALVVKLVLVTIFLSSGLLSATATTNVNETWEGLGYQGVFNGTGNYAWSGDVAGFRITNSAWPSAWPMDGTRSLRSNASTPAFTNTILTPFAFTSSSNTTWSVFISGLSQTLTSGRGVDMILASSTNDAASVEAGTVNGYRFRLAAPGGTDALQLQKAIGTGWTTLLSTNLGFSANLNSGWNLDVQRTMDGAWSFGYATGAVGSAVSLAYTVSDTTVLSGSYSGMTYYSPSSGANAFGFDNFLIVTSIPEPGVVGLFGLGVLGFVLISRQRQSRC